MHTLGVNAVDLRRVEHVSCRDAEEELVRPAEACEAVGAKFQKEQNVAIKTKLPVTILKTDNVLPKIDENE